MRFRVVVFAVVMVALMLGIALPSTISADRQSRLTLRLTTTIGPALDAGLGARAATNDAHRESNPTEGGDTRAAEVFAGAAQAASQEMAHLDAILASPEFDEDTTVLSSEMLPLQARHREAFDAWWAWAGAVQGRRPTTGEDAEGDRLYATFLQANQAVLDAVRRDRDQLREATGAGSERTTRIVVVTTGIAVLLALAVTWWTLQSLTHPIQALRDTVRRQREGHRTAWASIDRGAREVRELAADVNALTASHLELLDDQAMRLVFERAERDLTRALRDSPTLRTALFLTVESVAENLGVDHVVALTRDESGENAQVQHWLADDHTGCVSGDQVIRDALELTVDRIWTGSEQVMRIDDLADADARSDLSRFVDSGLLADTAGCLLVTPIGVQDRTIGVLVVHESTPRRPWRDAETAFLAGAADALARFVVAGEVELEREDYVRQLEELDRQKDTFLSTVSHELRTPLTSIAGYLEMLQDGDAGELTAPQAKMLETIGRNTVRLRSLIEDLLVLNRIQNAASTSTRELVDMGEIVRRAVEEHQASSHAQGLTLRSSVKEPAVVFGDRGNLTRAVSNILANAVKFTPAGGEVDLVAAVDEQTRIVRIVCSDTGIGIPDGESPRISERFFRGSNASTAQIPGTGLGLAIVRGIVESHGGRLSLTSTENSGTTVSVSLPGAPEA
ncbi:sensor histidine kinase [Mobilicoccus caccae]|uniref:sensor histidine kinase n=1 Tax=Mobilicoccus caccae TaxID=1859295 RepID=UPI0024E10F0E|nr:ATP-binding protein [Mobilicoccus caccae]